MKRLASHPLARPLAWTFTSLAGAALVACVGGAGAPGGAASLVDLDGRSATAAAHAPADSTHPVALGSSTPAVSTAGPADRLPQPGRGVPTAVLQAGAPVFNPVDGHFYGTTHQPGQRGTLWRLKPDTNAVEVLLRLNGRGLAQAAARQTRRVASAHAEVGQHQAHPGAWLSSPLVSADGHRLYLVADLGGRFLRGVVMQVDIDPASPTQGQAEAVFTFADQDLPGEDGCAEPAARTGYQLAWGAEEGDGRQLLLSRSRKPAVPAVLPGGALPEAARADTTACSLALLPRPGAASTPAWDTAEAVREAAPWPAALPGAPGVHAAAPVDRAGLLGANGSPLGGAHDSAARFQVSVVPAWAGQPLALLKRDLATGATDRLPLDVAGAALQNQPWLPLEAGLSLARVAQTPAGASGARRGSVGGLIETETPGQGLALVDAGSGRILRLAGQRPALQSAQSLVRLRDGSVWDVRLESGRSGNAWRTVYRVDARSLAATPVLSLADVGSARSPGQPAASAGRADPSSAYAVAGRGQALYLGTHPPSPARRTGAVKAMAISPAAQQDADSPPAPLRLSCLRTDLPGQVLAHVPLVASPREPGAPGEPMRLVGGPTHAPAQGAIYLATVQPGRDGAPDTAALLEVDRGVSDDALCRRAPQVVTLVAGLTDVPVTGVVATRDGRLLYASRSGRLMQLDPERRRVQAVADLRPAAAGQRQWVAALAEVAPGRLDALVQAQDGRGRPLGQHRVQVALASAGAPGNSQGAAASPAVTPAMRVSQAN